jgi:hypothetical protein
VTEAIGSDWNHAQRDVLSALGIELLTVRTRSRTVVASPVQGAMDPAVVRLVLRGVDGDFADGAPTPLFDALLRALDVRRDEVSATLRRGVPHLFIGDDADADQSRIPSLRDLRSAKAKRAAWPVLRQLRRALRSARSGS